jgi:hypothetical protein
MARRSGEESAWGYLMVIIYLTEHPLGPVGTATPALD